MDMIYIYNIYIYIYGSKTKKTGDTNSFGEFSMWGWIFKKKKTSWARTPRLRGCVGRAYGECIFLGILNTSVWSIMIYYICWTSFFDEKLGHVACFGFNIHGFGFPKATPSSAAQPGVPLKVPRTFPSTPGRSRQADGHGSWNPPSHSKPPRAQRVPIIVFVKVRKSLLMRSLLDFGGKISEFRWSTNHVAAGTQILRMKSAISRSSRSSREWEEVPHFFGTSGWMV